MKASRNEVLTRPFALTADDATKLVTQLSPNLPHLRLTAECADGITRTFAGIDELLSYENAHRKRITKLVVFAASQDVQSSVMIRFSSQKRNNVGIVINSEEQMMTHLWQTIETRLEAMRPWYYWLARIDFVYLVSGLVSLMGITIFAYGLAIHGRRMFEEPLSIGPIIIGALVGTLPLPVGWLLNKLSGYVFPTGVFAIGQGLNREQNANIIRTVVIAGFVVSVAAGIATALIIN